MNFLCHDNVKTNSYFISLKSAKMIVEKGNYKTWGQVTNVSENRDCFVLGYEPSMERKYRVPIKNIIWTIQEVFHNGGVIHDNQVYIIGDGASEEMPNLVCRCTPNTELDNWEAIEIHVIFPMSKYFFLILLLCSRLKDHYVGPLCFKWLSLSIKVFCNSIVILFLLQKMTNFSTKKNKVNFLFLHFDL